MCATILQEYFVHVEYFSRCLPSWSTSGNEVLHGNHTLTKNIDFQLCIVAYHSHFVVILRTQEYSGIRAKKSSRKVNIYIDIGGL